MKRWWRLLVSFLAALALLAGFTPPASAEASRNDAADAALDQAVAISGDIASDLATESIALDTQTDSGVLIPSDGSRDIAVPSASEDTVGIGLPTDEPAELVADDAAVYRDHHSGTAVAVHSLDPQVDETVAGGVLATITIPDAQAGTRFEFPLDLPPGSTLQPDDEGNVLAVDPAGEVLGVFVAPWAVDANGADVPTHFEVSGTTLIQHVDHVGAAYPVVADPAWVVPVVVVGTRAVVHVTVRAASRQAAKKAAMRVAHRQTGKKVSARAPKALKYKSFTARNARHNLIVRTGKNPGKKCQAHHTIPALHRDKAHRRGINVDDPKYLLWWSTSGSTSHQKKAYAYNKDWQAFMKGNPSKQQILQKRTQLVKKYGKMYRC